MTTITSLETNNHAETKSLSLRGEAQKKQICKGKRKAPSAKSKAAKAELIQKSVIAKQKIKLAIQNAKTPIEALAAASLRVNDILMQDHKKESGAQIFMTFKQWKEKGYSVNKGETSYKVWSAPIKGKREIEVTEVSTGKDKTLEEQYSMFAMCSLFNEKQVSKIEDPSTPPEQREEQPAFDMCIGEQVETIYNNRATTPKGKLGEFLGIFDQAVRIQCKSLIVDIKTNVEIDSDYYYHVTNIETGATATGADRHDLPRAVNAVCQPSKPPQKYLELPPKATTEKPAIKAAQKSAIKTPVINTALAEKLEALAEKQQSQIDGYFAERQTNTQKRLAEANRARCQGEKLLRTQKALLALAQCHRVGNVPEVLQSIKTKKAVFELMSAKSEPVNNGYHTYYTDTGERYHDSAEAVAIWELLTDKSLEQKAEQALQAKIESLQFTKIAGYFPTPKPVTDFMLELAQIEDNHIIADTSAGSGNILDAIKAEYPSAKLEAYEINTTLCEVLAAKGYSVIQGDSLTITSAKEYDRILINPPFEQLADIDHVQHSFSFLKAGGRMVAVMSASPFFRKDKKATQFKTWLSELNGEIHDLPANSFKFSGTGVNTKIILIDKPEQGEETDPSDNAFTCSNYEEKQDSRRERLEERAAKAATKSNALYDKARSMSEVIPFGQPILVGHHSEKRDRNYRQKIVNGFDKSMQEGRKAETLLTRADKVGRGGIASDDPTALTQLKTKLLTLEAQQTRMKLANKALKANDIEALKYLDFTDNQISLLQSGDFAGRTGFAPYQLTNNNAEIRRLKKRIASLETLQTSEPINIETDKYKIYVENGRIHLDFTEGKPSSEVRQAMRCYAFKWSRYSGTWVRKATQTAINTIEALESELSLIFEVLEE